ncbi:MAG TPA: GtrA family protein [Sphingomicrobium sp.]|nr:GtrA family protein [Sphingomicrobium sp.]
MIHNLHPKRRSVLNQLVRFVITGAFVTAIGIGVYALVALVLGWHPQLGNLLAYLTATAVGYNMHSIWSFRGHGGERTHATKAKFVVVSLISYALNSFWVWLLFTYFGFGPAVPILPMAFVTPAVTFFLNREWVFR